MGNVKSLLGYEMDRDLFKGFVGLKDVELTVSKVMRKYGEDCERRFIAKDYMSISMDEDIAIHIAGEEEVSDYWEGLKGNGGTVIGVCEYLIERFYPMYRHHNWFDESGYRDKLRWVLDEARRFEGEVSA